jgi:protein O-mannosyl-transferase
VFLRSFSAGVARGALAHPRWVIAVVAALAFANTLHNQPVFDDTWVIFDNPLIKHLDQVGAIFRQSYGAATPEERRGLYRPLTTLTYAVNWDIGGLDVLGYHLGNIGLHIAVCLLVYELATLLLTSSPGSSTTTGPAALAAGVVFAIHPVHVEAVTAMVGRDELLAACGALGCLYLTCTRQRARWRYPVALAALAGGVLSKENAAVTPLLFLVMAFALPEAAGLDARPGLSSNLGRRSLGRVAALVAGMAVVIGLYLLVRPAEAKIATNALWFDDLPGSVVFNTMTRVLAEYLRLLVFPVPLGLDFYYAAKIPITPTFTAICLADTVLWLLVLAVGLGSLKRAPLLAIGIGWVFVALLPVMNIVRIGVLMAERLVYLPSVGFCILAGLAAVLLVERARPERRGLLAAFAMALGALGVVKTWSRNADWRDGYALWRAEVRREPEGPIANNYAALEYMTRGELDSAGTHLMVALRVAPDYWDANLNAGRLAHKLHQDSAAVRLMERAHTLQPLESDPLFFLAVLRGEQGHLPEAVDLLAQAESVGATEAWTRICRGWFLKRLGRTAEADEELKRALELDPAVSLGNCTQ